MHDRPLPDWNTLTFSFTETDHVYRADGDAQLAGYCREQYGGRLG